jgi:hypothetical protein
MADGLELPSLRDIKMSRKGRLRSLYDVIKSIATGGMGEIPDGSITTSKLADGAVDYSKLAIIKAAIPLVDTETTGSAILDFGISSGYFPEIISCYPKEYDDGANVGQIQRVYAEYDEQEDAFIFKIDVDAGPGEGKNVVYIINALKVPILE